MTGTGEPLLAASAIARMWRTEPELRSAVHLAAGRRQLSKQSRRRCYHLVSFPSATATATFLPNTEEGLLYRTPWSIWSVSPWYFHGQLIEVFPYRSMSLGPAAHTIGISHPKLFECPNRGSAPRRTRGDVGNPPDDALRFLQSLLLPLRGRFGAQRHR